MVLRRLLAIFACLGAAVSAAAPNAQARDALIAVAANFADPMAALEVEFETQTDYDIDIVIGSTGKLHAQIVNGAPFDVFLAADDARPADLIDRSLALTENRVTYAIGRLALWTKTTDGAIGGLEDILGKGDFRRLAIANPKLAPYGRAALETLQALGLSEQLSPKLVMGENIGQAYAMTATGAAEFGFVAQAQLQSDTGARWNVPDHLHTPIRQDAVHLTRAKANPAATAFMRFLASEDAAELLIQLGYLRPGA